MVAGREPRVKPSKSRMHTLVRSSQPPGRSPWDSAPRLARSATPGRATDFSSGLVVEGVIDFPATAYVARADQSEEYCCAVLRPVALIVAGRSFAQRSGFYPNIHRICQAQNNLLKNFSARMSYICQAHPFPRKGVVH